MKYMALIYYAYEGREPIQPRRWQEYEAFTRETVERGFFQAGDALAAPETARTVRLDDGKTVVTDGPFIESKEQIGGFYIFDCQNLEEALELAARIPDAENGAIEVRPLAQHA